MKFWVPLLAGLLSGNFARAELPRPVLAGNPPPAVVPPSLVKEPIDVGRTLTQWFAIYGFGGVLSKGQKPIGGGIKIGRLRWRNTYFTIANLTFAYTVNPSDDAGYFGYFVQSGWKFAEGYQGRHVFYLGVEAGIGAVGYDINTPTGHRTHTAMSLHPISPHLEYNYHFSNHAAFLVEIKVLPPIFDGGKDAVGSQRGVIRDPPPWLFGGRVGLAF